MKSTAGANNESIQFPYPRTTMDASKSQKKSPPSQPARSVHRAWWVFGGFAAITLAMLGIEHQAHLLGWLPWLFLLACPLMHVFMHGGHGHGGHGKHSNKDAGDDK